MKKLLKGLDIVESNFIGILLIVVTFVLFGNVVFRYFLNSNLGWAEEFSRYGVVWITLIGASTCIAKGTHITVDAISGFLSARGRLALDIAVLAICLGCTAILFWYSLKLTLKITRYGQMSSTLGVPMMYVYGAMPVGFFLMGIRFVEKMSLRLKGEDESTDKDKRQGSRS